MKLALMQPYFFPYIGYYDLINRAQRWVVFDVAKYKPQSWMNRNRVLHPDKGWQYITVPVNKHAEAAAIKDITIADPLRARDRILRQIEHYRSAGAPYFRETCDIVAECFMRTTSGLLRDLNVETLRMVCSYLGISFPSAILSESRLTLPQMTHAGQWAVEICSALGADEYVNPPGGRAIFDEAEFDARHVRLRFTELVDFRYATGRYSFVDSLSVVDVLMWNSPSDVKTYLDGIAATRPELPL